MPARLHTQTQRLRTTRRSRPTDASGNAAPGRIVSAARRYFFAHGFRNVTMDDLAADLGMSKKTLYAAFPSKDALVEAVLKDKFHSVESDLQRLASDGSRDALVNLQRLLSCLQHHTAEIQPPFVRDVRRAAPDMFRLIEQRRRGLIRRYFGKVLAGARRRGIIRKDIRVDVMIEILLGATEALVNPEKLALLRLTPQQGYMDVITVVLTGLVTETGRGQL